MVLIILVIVYIPMQTSRIAELYNSMSQYQRASYTWTEMHPHVIISGSLSYGSMVDFCREYFVADPNGHVTILQNNEPSLEVRRLLNHPFYRNRLYYIRGDITAHRDLKRVKSANATGLFLFGDKMNGSAEESKKCDSSILMQSLKVKNWEAGLPIFVQIHDRASLEMAQSCGCDRIVCLQDIKVSLMARNCLVPGLIPFLNNLVNTFPDVSDADHAEFWKQEYQHGVGNQIQSFRIPTGLAGVSFALASKVLYHEYGGSLFAVMSATAGFNNNEIRVNPGPDYILSDRDIGLIIADTNDNIVPVLLYQYRQKVDWSKVDYNVKTLSEDVIEDDIVLKTVDTSAAETAKALALSTVTFGEVIELTPIETASPKRSTESLLKGCSPPANLSNHILICGCTSLENLDFFIQTVRQSGVDQQHAITSLNAHQDTPIVYVLESLPPVSSLWEDILAHKNVYVVLGRTTEMKTLRDARIENCKRVLIFADQKQEDVITADTSSVLIVKMIKRNWPNKPFLVEMLDGTAVRYFSREDFEWDSRNLKIQSVLNNYELSIPDRVGKYLNVRKESADNTSMWMQTLRFLLGEPSTQQSKQANKRRLGNDPSAFHALQEDKEDDNEEELDKKAVVKANDTSISGQYFQKLLEEAELNESGISAYPMYHFDRYYAAGMVSISSSLHSLLCQAYFRPFIIDAVKGLSEQLIHLQIPQSWSGKEYGEFYNYCMDRGYILLGLYRHGAKKSTGNDKVDIPFIYTNCKSFDIISNDDLAFAIKSCIRKTS